MEAFKNRVTEYPCDVQFLKRISTRAFDSKKQISDDVLMSCFEAARWAPSSYNNQPWRYVYARIGSDSYNLIFSSLIEFNQQWCKNVPILIVITSRQEFEMNQKKAPTASLDTGSSYMSFMLEAQKHGLATHPMEGFKRSEVRKAFNIPEIYTIEAILAVGYPGPKESLSKELQDKEVVSDRKPLKNIVSENNFSFS